MTAWKAQLQHQQRRATTAAFQAKQPISDSSTQSMMMLMRCEARQLKSRGKQKRFTCSSVFSPINETSCDRIGIWNMESKSSICCCLVVLLSSLSQSNDDCDCLLVVNCLLVALCADAIAVRAFPTQCTHEFLRWSWFVSCLNERVSRHFQPFFPAGCYNATACPRFKASSNCSGSDLVCVNGSVTRVCVLWRARTLCCESAVGLTDGRRAGF
jgi:hypothetical protein